MFQHCFFLFLSFILPHFFDFVKLLLKNNSGKLSPPTGGGHEKQDRGSKTSRGGATEDQRTEDAKPGERQNPRTTRRRTRKGGGGGGEAAETTSYFVVCLICFYCIKSRCRGFFGSLSSCGKVRNIVCIRTPVLSPQEHLFFTTFVVLRKRAHARQGADSPAPTPDRGCRRRFTTKLYDRALGAVP